jgi:3-deoxy-7-phosphoheptulonate synthase
MAKEVSKSFMVIMRAYFEKPRTTKGWKGLLYDPHLNDTQDIATGLRHSREVLLTLADLKVPAATEFLDPATPNYIGDVISWSCIGARTAESQVHRQFASGLPMPVAFKNSTSGNVDVAINGVLSAKTPHAYFGINESGHISIIRTRGNPHAHIVLRGGESDPNYDADSIAKALKKIKKNQLSENIIVDCSHDNSRRDHEKQTIVFQSIIDQYSQGNEAIKGLILESNLSAGCQPIPSDKSLLNYAISLTDPCLDWEATEALIREAASRLQKAMR